MNKYTKLLKNTSIMGVGAFLSKVLVFLLLPIYSSVMSTADYGVADIVAQSSNLLMPIVTLGICTAVFRFSCDKKTDHKAIFTVGFIILLFGMVLFAAFIPLFKKVYVLDEYLLLFGLYVFMYGLHTLCGQYLRGVDKVKEFAVKGVLCTVFTLVFNILLLVVFPLGVTGYLVANILADFFTVVYMFRVGNLVDAFDIKKFSFGLLFEMLKYSLPLVPTTICWWITNISDRYIVLYMVDESASGIYAMSYKIPNIITMITGIFSDAWQMSLIDESNQGSVSKFLTKIFESYKAVLFIVGSGLILFVKVITGILIKNDFYIAWKYTTLLVVATICMSMVNFISVIFHVKKKSVNSLICATCGAGINILGNILLIKSYGAVGAAIATVISYVIVYVVATSRSLEYVKYKVFFTKTMVNIGLLTVQSIIMMLVPGVACYIISAIIFIAVLALNLPVFLYSAKSILKTKK